MRRVRRVLLWFACVFLLVFAGLWVAGPEPVVMGPYVQHVTSGTADVCSYDELPTRVGVTLRGDGKNRTLTEDQPTSAHRFKLEGLKPGTRYEYSVFDLVTRVERWSGSFKTTSADAAEPFSFAALGDSGDVPHWHQRLHSFGWGRLRGLLELTERTGQWDVAEWVAEKNPDFLAHLGDIIYSRNELPAYEEAFFRPFEPVLGTTPVVAVVGNHDIHDWEHPKFFELFQPPESIGQTYSDYSHTFAWGGVRFLVLEGFYEHWEDGSSMRSWLENTLEENTLPRTIVITHLPAFSDEEGVTEYEFVQTNLWPVLARHGVDLVVAGDSHSYQRFKPIDGITLVIAGTGGKSIRPVATTDRLASHAEQFGFLLVKVDGTRIEGEFWTGGEQPFDSFVVTK